MTNYNCSKLHEKQLLLQCKIYIEGVEGDESKIQKTTDWLWKMNVKVETVTESESDNWKWKW